MKKKYEYVIKPGFLGSYRRKVIIRNKFEAFINGNSGVHADFVAAFNRVWPEPVSLSLNFGLDEYDVAARENIKQLLACVIRNSSIKELELNLQLKSQFSNGLNVAAIIEVFQNNRLDLNRLSIYLNRGSWCPKDCFDPIFASLRGTIQTLDCSFNAGYELRGIRSLNFAQISLQCLELELPREDYHDPEMGSRTFRKIRLDNFTRTIPVLKLKNLTETKWGNKINPDFIHENFKELAGHFTELDLTALFTTNHGYFYHFHHFILQAVPSSISHINLQKNILNKLSDDKNALKYIAGFLPHIKTMRVSVSEIDGMTTEQLEQFARIAPNAKIIAYDEAGLVTSSTKTIWLQDKMARYQQQSSERVVYNATLVQKPQLIQESGRKEPEKKQILTTSSSIQTEEPDNKENRAELFFDFVVSPSFAFAFYASTWLGSNMGYLITGLIALPGLAIDTMINNSGHYELNYFDFKTRNYENIHSCGFFAKYPLGMVGEVVGACAGAVVTLSTGIALTAVALSIVLAALAFVLAETIITLFIDAIHCCVVGPNHTAREFGF